MIKNLSTWILAALLSGLSLGLADAFTLCLTARAMFFDTAEMFNAATWALGICTASGVLAISLLGLATEAFIRVKSKHKGLIALVPFIIAVPVFVTLLKLTAGPQASQIPGRILIITLLSLAGGLVTALTIVFSHRWSQTKRGAVLVAVAALVITTTVYLLDCHILVHHYPTFHVACTFLAFVISATGFRLFFEKKKMHSAVRTISIILAMASVYFGAISVLKVRSEQNARFVISKKTATASDILYLAKLIIPPPSSQLLDETTTDFESTQESPNWHAVSAPSANVVLLTIDALRSDRIANPRAKRRPAPNIDALAKRSVVFKNAYTPIPHTSYAISSLMTGKYTKPLFDVPDAPKFHETWPKILERFRYKTAAFYTNAIFFIDKARFQSYQNSGYGFSVRKVDYNIPAAKRIEALMDFLHQMKDKSRPHFSWIHFFEPHEPYDEECTRFGTEPVDRYDCEIAKVDFALKKLFDYLAQHQPRTIVILTSDHGEEFGDHGGNYHGTSLYDEQSRVPLIIHIPGLEPREVTEPVSLVDLLGTTLGILDLPIPARIRSRDLSGLMVGRAQSMDVYSEVHDEVMIIKDKNKLICDVKDDLCRLYDLKNDPGETISVASKKPEILAQLKKRMTFWRKSHAQFELRPIQTQKGAKPWPKAIKQALGADDSSIQGLWELVKNKNNEPKIRQKSAELLHNLWAHRSIEEIKSQTDENDPVVAGWLLTIKAKAGDKNAVASLNDLYSRLKRGTKIQRAASLVRLEAGIPEAVDDVMEIAQNSQFPIEQRIYAVELLGKHGSEKNGPALIQLLENYQLCLEAANSLALLKIQNAAGPIAVCLNKERFTDRKRTLLNALITIDNPTIAPAIAAELLEDPSPKTLTAIKKLLGNKNQTIKIEDKIIAIHSRLSKKTIQVKMSEINRVVVQTNGDEKNEIIISCNHGKKINKQIKKGTVQTIVDLKLCKSQDNKKTITLSIVPSKASLIIDTVAVIGN